VATSIAEYSGTRASDVLLMVDSLDKILLWPSEKSGFPSASRRRQKDPPLSVLQSPCRSCSKGSVPCERKGSITGLYAILVEGNDFDEPIADAARSILDGHIVLSRSLAAKNDLPGSGFFKTASAG